MIIEHSRFKNALVHLANRLNKKYPENKYWLIQARLGGNGWTITISRKTTAMIDAQRLPPPIVNFDELTEDDHDSLENIVIDSDNISRFLEVADDFVRTVDNLTRVRLFSLNKLADAWRITYFAKNTETEDVVITLDINTDGIIIFKEIDVIPPNKR